MKLRLEHKLALKQILTPQLVQTMELIQLPILELSQKLKQEITENPMLDIVQEEPVKENTREDDTSPMELAEYKKLLKGLRQMDTNLYQPGYDGDDEDEMSPIERVAYERSLYDILIKQLSLNEMDPRIRELGEYIIGNLSDDGMLHVQLDELRDSAENQGVIAAPTLEEMEEALSEVQKLEPVGVGARDLRECYMIQLENCTDFDALAYEIVMDHFNILGKKNLPEMQKIFDEPIERIKDALYVIYQLKATPVPTNEDNFDISVEPDIEIRKIDDTWQVIYNSFDIPHLGLNRHYMELLKKSGEMNDEIKDFLKKKLDSAKWWIDALELRQQNMVNTMNAIIENQIDFFEHGPDFIKPMKMEDVANDIGVHPATISRIAKDKFVQTPHGIFPLKYFFTRGLSTDDGEDMSTRVIKQKIGQYIEKENKAKPLSDQNIADILTADGINIARRTVAKYREQLGLPSARMRKMK